MVAISFSARTETSVTIAMSAITAGVQTVEVQYATRRDFEFCIAPILDAGKGAAFVFATLNRAQTYWIRAREVNADNSRGKWGEPLSIATLVGVDTVVVPTIQIQPALIVAPQPMVSWNAYLNIGVNGFPPSNLAVASPAIAYRTTYSGATGSCGFWVETSGEPIDTIALLDTNLPDGATIRFVASDDVKVVNGAAGGVATVSTYTAARASANLRGRRGYHALIRLPAPLSLRYWRIEISGAQPPNGLLHITHAVMGLARVIKNYSDMTDQTVDLGSFDRLRDGSPDSVAGFRMRKVDFTVSVLTETQHETVFGDLGMMVGTNEPVFVIPNTKAGPYLHDRLLYGNISASRQTNGNMRFERTMTIDSIVN